MKEKAEKKAIEFRRPKRGKLRKITCKQSLFIMNMRTVPNEFLITIDPNYWQADPLTRIVNPNSPGGINWPF